MPRAMRKVIDRRPRRLGCATHAAMAPTRRGPQVEPKPRCDYQTFLCNHSICGRPVSSLTVGCDTHSRAHAHADTHTHSHTRIPPYTRRPMSPGGRAGGACDSDICCLTSTTTGDGLATHQHPAPGCAADSGERSLAGKRFLVFHLTNKDRTVCGRYGVSCA